MKLLKLISVLLTTIILNGCFASNSENGNKVKEIETEEKLIDLTAEEELEEFMERLDNDPERCEFSWDIDEDTVKDPLCTKEMIQQKKEEQKKRRDDKWKELCDQQNIDTRIAEECLWFNTYFHCEDLDDEWFYDPFEFEEIKNQDVEPPKSIQMSQVKKCENRFIYFQVENAIDGRISDMPIGEIMDKLTDIENSISDLKNQ